MTKGAREGGHARPCAPRPMVARLSGIVTAFYANSTPKISTFFPQSHFDFGGEYFIRQLNPKSKIMIVASEIDKMK